MTDTDLRPSFHAGRLTGIGGSDESVVLGLSPFKTRFELYLEKRGELTGDFADTPLTRAGRIMEQVIAAMYAEARGVRVRRVNRQLRHQKYPWLVANIDRDVVGMKMGVEIKNVSPRIGYRWGASGDPDGVAEYYLPQAHHYMLVMDYTAFEVAAYFGGDDLRIYPLRRDPEWDDIILGAASDFWHGNVLAGVPPELDTAHPTALPLLARLYPGTDGRVVDADIEMRHVAEILAEQNRLATAAKFEANSAKAALLDFMGEAAVLRLGDGRVFRRKVVTRNGYEVAPSTYVDARFAKE